MAHAKSSDLSHIGDLLAKIRTIGLKEKSFGCFYHKSKAVLHFHIKDDRLYAHVFDGKNWQEVDIAPDANSKVQSSYFKKIETILPIS